MPAVAVVAAVVGVGEVAAGLTALSAATTMLATIEAGAMIVGGALSTVGALTGSKDLSQAGALIGAAGTLGAGLSGNMPTMTDIGKHFGLTSDAAQGAGVVNAASSANTTSITDQLTGAATSGGDTTGAVANVSNAQVSGNAVSDIASKVGGADAATAANQQLQKYSLLSGAMQGVGTAVAARTTSDTQAQIAADQLAFNQSVYNTAKTNANSLPSNINIHPTATGMLAAPTTTAMVRTA